MERIAQSIARLRRERGMTQEALAEVIGVSAQTISKWETATNCPDAALLPVIADVFGVTVDALYGREAGHAAVTPEEAIDRVIECVRETIVGTCWEPARDGSFREELAQYKRAMKQDVQTRSIIENDRDVLYFREELGALALRRPEAGWSSLFVRQDAAAMLRLASEDAFRRAMYHIISRRMLTFTLPSLMKQCGLTDEKALEAQLTESGLFSRRELLIDDAPLTYFELTGGERRLYLVYAMLAFAAEAAGYQPVHYCFIGNMNYFTP